jgi:S-adenosylmethionine-diacylgycerolhomoserine-N-methlytransferase
MATTEEMDRMYRWTRHVYDFSRKCYLLGRDGLLREMELQAGDCVVEIGCGTARNLIKLARMRPDVRCFGVDVSTEMLATATAKVKSRRLQDRVTLALCFAEQLDYAKTFQLNGPFDAAFFSYSLSMIPTFKEAIDAALANVKRGGAIYVVDFWDQGEWPGWFRFVLKKWLDLFHVRHRPELLEYLKELDAQGMGSLRLKTVARRYAYLATFRKL